MDWEERDALLYESLDKVTKPAPTTHSSKGPSWPKVASKVIKADGLQQPLPRSTPNRREQTSQPAYGGAFRVDDDAPSSQICRGGAQGLMPNGASILLLWR